jgi:hypothetical protein
MPRDGWRWPDVAVRPQTLREAGLLTEPQQLPVSGLQLMQPTLGQVASELPAFSE